MVGVEVATGRHRRCCDTAVRRCRDAAVGAGSRRDVTGRVDVTGDIGCRDRRWTGML